MLMLLLILYMATMLSYLILKLNYCIPGQLEKYLKNEEIERKRKKTEDNFTTCIPTSSNQERTGAEASTSKKCTDNELNKEKFSKQNLLQEKIPAEVKDVYEFTDDST